MAECSALRVAARAKHGGGVGAWTHDRLLGDAGRLDPDHRRPDPAGRSSACCCRWPSCCWPTARSGPACRCAKAPTWSGPFGLLQSFADFFKFVLKEIVIPAGADKVGLPAGAADQLHPGLRRLGGDPVRAGLGGLRPQRRHPLPASRSRSLGVYGIIMGGWASNSKYPFLGAPALGGADGVLRGLHRLHDHHRDPAGRLDEPDRRSSTQQAGGFWNWYAFGGGAANLAD